MSAPLVPSPLDYIGRKSFAFYPPVCHSGPNSRSSPNLWILGASSWSEVQVINAQTGVELWIPRQFIGAVSGQDESLIVGLTQQLELRKGKVVPHTSRRVLQMPVRRDSPVTRHHEGPAHVIGIRLEKSRPAAFQKAPFRVCVCVLFVVGLLALVVSASR
jgi:hypothetical protein